MINRRSLISVAPVALLSSSKTSRAPRDGQYANASGARQSGLMALTPGNAADTSAAFQLASTKAGNAGAFVVAPGHYTLAVSPEFTDAGIAGIGAQISGSIPAIGDGTLRDASSFWFARQASRPHNQATISCHMVGSPSGLHTVSFEKDAFASSQTIYDNSTYVRDGDATVSGVAASSRDFAGFGSHTTIPAGYNLLRTRSWGAACYTVIGKEKAEGAADGYAVGVEARIDNYGSNAPLVQTSTTKTTLQLIGGGNRRITSFSFSSTGGGTGGSGAGAGAYYGHVVDSAAVSRYAFSVMEINGRTPQNTLWGVTPTGAMALKAQGQPENDLGRAQIYFDGTNLKMILPNGVVKTFVAV